MSWLKGLFSSQPAARPEAALGRNDECWCGSGRKYKRCHWKEDEGHRYEAAHAARVAAQQKPAGGGARRKVAPADQVSRGRR